MLHRGGAGYQFKLKDSVDAPLQHPATTAEK